ncbi:hypothetical protein BDF20DRAFT_904734 [Mycotypha africana]|uniref:uncharacterized protein n=1 Tax=Mycotypha africana TaxID=64632 RepID=UPI0023017192|nr:uncharacterized protein BDF20DRAFT_904734 [Mycotypha africana]KAI8987825.1 hypothetical protein BDF20DRAFT_904734 [Mycotypha africana]
MASQKATLIIGGAALGAVSLAAYQKLTQKPNPRSIQPLPPQNLPSPPSTQQQHRPTQNQSPVIPVSNFEISKEILPFGFPGPVNDIVYRSAYVTSYNRRDRNPNWVAEHLTAAKLKRGEDVDRSKSTFKEDEHIPAKFRAKLSDYFRSGFDRGHMVPAADVKNSQVSMDETFYLTNIAPQVGEGFNRDYWAHLEHFCRQLTKQFSDVYVFTGPMYLPHQEADGKFYVKYQVIGNPPNVAVPTHFYKVILTHHQGRYSVGAFVLPNARISDATPITAFQVPLDAVERGTGLTFFKQSPVDKNKIPDLCKETECRLVIRQFNNAQNKALPAK